MKKVLLCTAAIALGMTLSAPAKAADGIKLGVGGNFKGYVVWGRQDAENNVKDRTFDILRNSEISLSGETTLDNGLTVGIYNEFNIDSNNQIDSSLTPSIDPDTPSAVGTVQTRESYAYFSGAWGRVNFGKEDGANYLLQVAAPSADNNLDGLRQYINPVNYAITNATGFFHSGVRLDRWLNRAGVDYSADVTGDYNKLTYLTPVFSGFQFGGSYTPDVNNFGADQNGLQGVHQSDGQNIFGAAWEGSGRYEGRFQNLDITVGTGYSNVSVEQRNAPSAVDAWHQWNVGANVGWEAFNFGLAYRTDNGGRSGGIDNDKTWVAGVDYTTGPYKLGFSYLNDKLNLDSTVNQADSTRYTGGLVYTYGPGMTFRGSVSYINTDLPTGTSNVKATDVLLGTQINF
jgi:hypothetical protein